MSVVKVHEMTLSTEQVSISTTQTDKLTSASLSCVTRVAMCCVD